MNSDYIFYVFAFIIAAAFIANIVYGLVKSKSHGVKGTLLYNSKIIEEIGEVYGKDRGIVKQSIRINLLSNENDKNNIGLAFIAKSALSYQIWGTALNKDEAKKLAEYINITVEKADKIKAD